MNRVTAFFKEKGFYLALLACIAAAALCSFWAIRTVTQQLGSGKQNEMVPGGDDLWQLPQQQVEQKVEDVPVKEPAKEPREMSGDVPQPSQAPASSSASSSGPAGGQPGSTAPAAAQDTGFVQPVSGPVAAAYSGNELVYNETLGDWRTHNGVDISCAADAAVKACRPGKVTAVYDDGLYGTTVEVSSGELLYRYCGLAAGVEVETGDEVQAGTRLGTIGRVNAEANQPTHLHFEVLKGGAWQDPMTVLRGE